MEFSFPHYLLAKQSVDDSALNRVVLESLKANLPREPFRIIEVGAGIGTMLRRLVRWDILHEAEYVLVDEMPENVEFARAWIPQWAAESGLDVERGSQNVLRLSAEGISIRVTLEHADVFDFINKNPAPAKLLIAHAFLDLLPMPASLPKLLSLTNSLAWFTINFDGVTSLEPAVDASLDANIERLYHETMDARASGGDSRAGRHLFEHLRGAQAEIIAAGASDWMVHATRGKYPADEEYFLHCILHFSEESLTGNPMLDAAEFTSWLRKRRAQIERGELVYIAHQTDFLVRPSTNSSAA